MRKVQKISEIEPTINFTEFDFYNSFKKSFLDSELGKLYSSFPMQAIADACKLKSSSHSGRKSYFTPAGKIALMILKAYTNASDFELLNHLNSNIHHCIRRPRNKYLVIQKRYLDHSKNRRRKKSRTKVLKRSLLHLCNKLSGQLGDLLRSYPDSIMLQQQLFHKWVFQFAGDKAYGTNKNRKWCNDRGIR